MLRKRLFKTLLFDCQDINHILMIAYLAHRLYISSKYFTLVYGYWATNYIHQLDAALIRQGCFDCIIPVGDLDEKSRSLIFNHFLANTNHGDVDITRIVSELSLFTPADIEFLFHKVSHFAFEKEYTEGNDFRITTDTFLDIIIECQPSLTIENIRELEEDSACFTRF